MAEFDKFLETFTNTLTAFYVYVLQFAEGTKRVECRILHIKVNLNMVSHNVPVGWLYASKAGLGNMNME